nr:hypothetical protein [Kiritimatiellia bacterium]
AGFDLSNGVNLWWNKVLVSAAASDGGLFKKGSGVLVISSANAYNGPTDLRSGRIQARVDNALPAGSVLRLGGGADTRFVACTYDSETPQRETVQRLSRVEGSGELDYMSASSVNGAVAPSADGTITFMTACSISGDYEVTVGESGCGLLVLKGENQSIAGLKVKVTNATALDKKASRNAYKILEAPKGFTGRFDEGSLPKDWNLRYVGNSVYLHYNKGTIITIL